jgi:ATP-binding cassette subfamily B protein
MTDLRLPEYMAEIVNEGIVNKNSDLILHTGLTMLLIALLGATCTIGVGYLAAKIATGFSLNLRQKVFTKIEGFSMEEFDKFSTASLITRSTNDIQQIQMVLIMMLRLVLSSPILAIGAIMKAYKMAPSMSWIIALAVAVLFGLIIVLFAFALPKFKILQKLVDRLNLVTRENLTGLRIIRAFNTEKYEENKFNIANINLTEVNLFVNRLMVIMQPMMMLIFNFTSIGIVWVGAHFIDSGSLMIGDMIAFMQYAMQVIMSFLMISMVFIMVPRASVSAQRVTEVLDTKPKIKDPKKPKNFDPSKRGQVEFKNVSFSYYGADTPAIQDISFTAIPGETIAFVGGTGSGKSTLINLIPRFHDATIGEVTVDGVNIREVNQKDLHEKIGYVPQKSVLFSGTVASNIRYGSPNSSKKEVEDTAKIAQALDFVTKLDKKFAAPISQGGANISGGQKQRLSIARAIAKNPEIYIFDDSFSALDFATDAALRKALSIKTKTATVLIVAQRVGTIMNADKIIVLDKGKIVAEGKHKELLKTSKIYREIALSQLSEKELRKNDRDQKPHVSTPEAV